MKPCSRVFDRYGTTIFEVMSRLAVEHNAINLGQGFPDGNGPLDVRQRAAEALEDRPNQYPPMLGLPELRQAVAAHNQRFYRLDVDAESEVMVTSGATEALAAAMLGLLNPGDEVVLFEPVYDSYVPIIELAGAIPRFVRLTPPGWHVAMDDVAAVMSEKTKLVVLNSPMNPSGKVFSEAELHGLAELMLRYDAYAICDEVYEHLCFDGERHRPLMTLPGMRDRCARIGSAGKTFSLTGWKVGYVTAAATLLRSIAKAHQFLTFTTPPNLQRAVAYGLGKDDGYFSDLCHGMQSRRDLLAHGLADIGFSVAECKGTYFVNADFRPLGFVGTDVEFCKYITTQAKVAAIPVSAFYHDASVDYLARFCFCKNEETLVAALGRLAACFPRA